METPTHYKQDGIECIDVMQAIVCEVEFNGFLRLNTLKYIYRSKHKNDEISDLKKAQYYLDRLVLELERKK